MMGLFVLLGKERTKRMTFKTTRISIGAGNDHHLVLRDEPSVAADHVTIELVDGLEWFVTAHAPTMISGYGFAPQNQRFAVTNGTRLGLGGYELQLAYVSEMALDPVEQRLIAAIVARDDASREVYADWLEERGHVQRAEFLRLQDAAEVEGRSDEERAELAANLRALAIQLDDDWKMKVATLPIERCALATSLPCPMRWSRLSATKEPGVRACDVCRKAVYYCTTLGDARHHSLFDAAPVAVDLRVSRYPNDLAPP